MADSNRLIALQNSKEPNEILDIQLDLQITETDEVKHCTCSQCAKFVKKRARKISKSEDDKPKMEKIPNTTDCVCFGGASGEVLYDCNCIYKTDPYKIKAKEQADKCMKQREEPVRDESDDHAREQALECMRRAMRDAIGKEQKAIKAAIEKLEKEGQNARRKPIPFDSEKSILTERPPRVFFDVSKDPQFKTCCCQCTVLSGLDSDCELCDKIVDIVKQEQRCGCDHPKLRNLRQLPESIDIQTSQINTNDAFCATGFKTVNFATEVENTVPTSEAKTETDDNLGLKICVCIGETPHEDKSEVKRLLDCVVESETNDFNPNCSDCLRVIKVTSEDLYPFRPKSSNIVPLEPVVDEEKVEVFMTRDPKLHPHMKETATDALRPCLLARKLQPPKASNSTPQNAETPKLEPQIHCSCCLARKNANKSKPKKTSTDLTFKDIETSKSAPIKINFGTESEKITLSSQNVQTTKLKAADCFCNPCPIVCDEDPQTERHRIVCTNVQTRKVEANDISCNPVPIAFNQVLQTERDKKQSLTSQDIQTQKIHGIDCSCNPTPIILDEVLQTEVCPEQSFSRQKKLGVKEEPESTAGIEEHVCPGGCYDRFKKSSAKPFIQKDSQTSILTECTLALAQIESELQKISHKGSTGSKRSVKLKTEYNNHTPPRVKSNDSVQKSGSDSNCPEDCCSIESNVEQVQKSKRSVTSNESNQEKVFNRNYECVECNVNARNTSSDRASKSEAQEKQLELPKKIINTRSSSDRSKNDAQEKKSELSKKSDNTRNSSSDRSKKSSIVAESASSQECIAECNVQEKKSEVSKKSVNARSSSSDRAGKNDVQEPLKKSVNPRTSSSDRAGKSDAQESSKKSIDTKSSSYDHSKKTSIVSNAESTSSQQCIAECNVQEKKSEVSKKSVNARSSSSDRTSNRNAQDPSKGNVNAKTSSYDPSKNSSEVTEAESDLSQECIADCNVQQKQSEIPKRSVNARSSSSDRAGKSVAQDPSKKSVNTKSSSYDHSNKSNIVAEPESDSSQECIADCHAQQQQSEIPKKSVNARSSSSDRAGKSVAQDPSKKSVNTKSSSYDPSKNSSKVADPESDSSQECIADCNVQQKQSEIPKRSVNAGSSSSDRAGKSVAPDPSKKSVNTKSSSYDPSKNSSKVADPESDSSQECIADCNVQEKISDIPKRSVNARSSSSDRAGKSVAQDPSKKSVNTKSSSYDPSKNSSKVADPESDSSQECIADCNVQQKQSEIPKRSVNARSSSSDRAGKSVPQDPSKKSVNTKRSSYDHSNKSNIVAEPGSDSSQECIAECNVQQKQSGIPKRSVNARSSSSDRAGKSVAQDPSKKSVNSKISSYDPSKNSSKVVEAESDPSQECIADCNVQEKKSEISKKSVNARNSSDRAGKSVAQIPSKKSVDPKSSSDDYSNKSSTVSEEESASSQECIGECNVEEKKSEQPKKNVNARSSSSDRSGKSDPSKKSVNARNSSHDPSKKSNTIAKAKSTSSHQCIGKCNAPEKTSEVSKSPKPNNSSSDRTNKIWVQEKTSEISKNSIYSRSSSYDRSRNTARHECVAEWNTQERTSEVSRSVRTRSPSCDSAQENQPEQSQKNFKSRSRSPEITKVAKPESNSSQESIAEGNAEEKKSETSKKSVNSRIPTYDRYKRSNSAPRSTSVSSQECVGCNTEETKSEISKSVSSRSTSPDCISKSTSVPRSRSFSCIECSAACNTDERPSDYSRSDRGSKNSSRKISENSFDSKPSSKSIKSKTSSRRDKATAQSESDVCNVCKVTKSTAVVSSCGFPSKNSEREEEEQRVINISGSVRTAVSIVDKKSLTVTSCKRLCSTTQPPKYTESCRSCKSETTSIKSNDFQSMSDVTCNCSICMTDSQATVVSSRQYEVCDCETSCTSEVLDSCSIGTKKSQVHPPHVLLREKTSAAVHEKTSTSGMVSEEEMRRRSVERKKVESGISQRSVTVNENKNEFRGSSEDGETSDAEGGCVCQPECVDDCPEDCYFKRLDSDSNQQVLTEKTSIKKESDRKFANVESQRSNMNPMDSDTQKSDLIRSEYLDEDYCRCLTEYPKDCFSESKAPCVCADWDCLGKKKGLCQCRDCKAKNKVKEDSIHLERTIKEIIRHIECVCNQAEMRQENTVDLSIAGLQSALSTLQDKCKVKDMMIEQLSKQLCGRVEEVSRKQKPTLYSPPQQGDCGGCYKRSSKLQRSKFPTCICTQPPPLELYSSLMNHSRENSVIDCFNCPNTIEREMDCTSCNPQWRQTQLEKMDCCPFYKVEQVECRCVPNPVTLDPTPLDIIEIRKISSDSVLVKWLPPACDQVIGYEVEVNKKMKTRVLSPGRTTAILYCVNLSAPIEVKVYAVSKYGRLQPPATSMFPK